MSEELRLSDGRHVGMLTDTGELVKAVQGSIHMVRLPRGWALDKPSLDALGDKVKSICIHDLDSGISYRVSIEKFRLYAKLLDRGHGEQLCLPEGYWDVDGKPAIYPKPKADPKPDKPRQSSFL